MSTEYSVRTATHEDVTEILTLLKIAMPESTVPKDEKYWEWKHFQNPFGVSPSMIAVNGGQIIGFRTFMRWTWKASGQNIPSMRAVDTATHPDWRGKGIFSDLTRRLLDQIRSEGTGFIFNTPNRSSLPGYLKMGWKKVTRIPICVRTLKLKRSMLHLLAADHDNTEEIRSDSRTVCEAFSDPRVEQLFAQNSGDARYHTPKDMRFLRWRYLEVPLFSYNARWHYKENDWAFIIFRQRTRRGLNEVSISEMLMSPTQRGLSLATMLLNEFASDSGADYLIAVAAQESPERTALRAAGFRAVPKIGPTLVARPVNESFMQTQPPLFDWSSWRCSLGDLEIF